MAGKRGPAKTPAERAKETYDNELEQASRLRKRLTDAKARQAEINGTVDAIEGDLRAQEEYVRILGESPLLRDIEEEVDDESSAGA